MNLLNTDKARQTQTRTAFTSLAKKVTNGMYLGKVDQRAAEQHLVRGFTMSNMHKDLHHCVGEFLHHDFVILQRTNTQQQCIITEVDLHIMHDTEHTFVLPNSLNHELFSMIITRYPHHRHAPYAPGDHFSPHFKNTFSIFTKPIHFTTSLQLINKTFASCIDTLKQPFIYEITDRSLLIYNFNKAMPTVHDLEVQVKLGCTLATALETK